MLLEVSGSGRSSRKRAIRAPPSDGKRRRTVEAVEADEEQAEPPEELTPPAVTVDMEEEPVVYRQVSMRSLNLLQALNQLRNGAGTSVLPDVFVPVRPDRCSTTATRPSASGRALIS